MKHNGNCERKQEISTIRTSDESHLYWKNQIQKNPFCFRIIADFEVDNENHVSSIGK